MQINNKTIFIITIDIHKNKPTPSKDKTYFVEIKEEEILEKWKIEEMEIGKKPLKKSKLIQNNPKRHCQKKLKNNYQTAG